MPELFQTPMGHRFYESTMPRIAKALEDVSEKLDRIAAPALPPSLIKAMRGVVGWYDTTKVTPGEGAEEFVKSLDYMRGYLEALDKEQGIKCLGPEATSCPMNTQ